MTNQQKIEFYLSKGFVCEVEFKNGDKVILYFIEDSDWVYGTKNGHGQYWTNEDLKSLKWCNAKLTPIPPKPYEFSVGERVLITAGCNEGKIGIIEKQKEDYYSVKIDGQLLAYWPRTLAPALPEDEECEVIEVVKIPEFYIDELNVTKPDGKKLKIKVVKKQ
jgi:hypothetical protein